MSRRKVEAKNYEELIVASEEKVVTLSSELKEQKAYLKQLKKDQIRYEAVAEKRRQQEEITKAAELLVSSGKSLEEIEAFLQS